MDTKDDIVVEGDLESGVIKIPISFKETWKRKKVEGKTKVKDDIGKKKQKKDKFPPLLWRAISRQLERSVHMPLVSKMKAL